MTRKREPVDCTIALSGGVLSVIPLRELASSVDIGTRRHMGETLAEMLAHPPVMKASTAEKYLEKLTADPLTITVREPSLDADFGTERGSV